MPAFRVSGATGQAPTTSFFGAIPDKFNLLVPAHMESEPSQTPDALVACNFVNQMTPWNQSFGGGPNVVTGTFGAFTTAPDGTNTGQLFSESVGNSVHLLQAALYTDLPQTQGSAIGVREFGTLTLAGFFKYNNRRITMDISGQASAAAGNGDPTISGGCQTTFDLANGVIGVAPFIFGIAVGGYSSPSASISSFGNGWYLCSLTVVVNHSINVSLGHEVYTSVYLDNGTGSAAASISYVGDGTSGVYGWRINLMPQGAYGLTGQTIFFDDFLSSNTIDLTNSLAPGFNWYLQHSTSFRQLGPSTPFPPTSAGILSVSGSVLSIAPSGSGTSELDSCAALSTAQNSATVGNATYGIPGLYECRMNWDYNLSNGTTASPSFWCEAMAFLVQQPFAEGAGAILTLPGKEYDFMEGITIGGGIAPGASAFTYDPTSRGISDETAKNPNGYGFAKWQQFLTYAGDNFGVFYTVDGKYYTSSAPSVNQPPGTPGKWTLYSTVSGLPAPVTVTFEDFHVYSVLVLPYKRGSFGLFITWLDGVPTAISAYAPVNNVGSITNGVFGSTIQHVADGQLFRLNLQGCAQTCTTRFDWVKVTY